MTPAGFESTISADERSQTYALTSRPLESAVPWRRPGNIRRYQRKKKFVQTLQCENLQPQHKQRTQYRITECHTFLLWEAERPSSVDAETLLMAVVCGWVQQLSFHNSISRVDSLLEVTTTLIDPSTPPPRTHTHTPKTVEQIYYQFSQNGSRYLSTEKNNGIQPDRTDKLWYC